MRPFAFALRRGCDVRRIEDIARWSIFMVVSAPLAPTREEFGVMGLLPAESIPDAQLWITPGMTTRQNSATSALLRRRKRGDRKQEARHNEA